MSLPRRPSKPPSVAPISKPLRKFLVKKTSSFPPEPPTTPSTPQYRSSKLVKDWNQCSPEHQKAIEKMASHYAAVAGRNRLLAKKG